MEWTRQDFRDAARLLAVLEQRSKNRRAGRLGPVALEIADQPMSQAEKADGGSDQGVSTLDHRPQLTATRQGLEVGSGSVNGGRATCMGELRTNGCAHPDPDDTIGYTDRTQRAPGLR